jgi:hypothetical protein
MIAATVRSLLGADSGPSLPTVDLDADTVYRLLTNERRRMVIRALASADAVDGVPIGTLASRLAAEENDVAIGEVTSQQRKRVYVSLYQTHLPTLLDADAVGGDTNTPRATDTTRALAEYIERSETAFVGGAD